MTPARAEVQPAELGRLLDFAERAREHDWSMRAALTRYAQAQPQRASDVIELMRRTEFGLRPHLDAVQRDGEAVWAAVATGGDEGSEGGFVVELLRAMAELDRLGDALAAWAHDRRTDRPDALVDAVTADVAQRLDQLGVAREERPARPPGRAGRGGRGGRGV